jgi:hypothetical protein
LDETIVRKQGGEIKTTRYMIIPQNMSSEADAISILKKLLESNCIIEKVQPHVMASDAEVNIVIVTVLCPDGKKETIKAYREDPAALREFIRTHQ